MLGLKEKSRIQRHKRICKRIQSRPDCPRLCVHRSLKNIYIQVIDDQHSTTLLSVSSLDEELKNKCSYGGNVAAAGIVGEIVAQRLKQKGINRIVFDRGGYLYHGRIKAVAEGLRKGGITF